MTMRVSMRQAAAIVVIAATLIAGCSADTPEALVASAKEYIAKNDNKAAVIQLKNALQKSPNLAEARFLLGSALLDSGDVVGAEKELRKAQELKYPAEQVIPPLARSLVLLRQYQKLTDEFAKVELAIPESKAELQAAIGQAQLALGNTAAATNAFSAALAAQPKYVPAHLGLARISASRGDLAQALATVESALAISSDYADGWQLKGDLLLAKGQQDPALAAYRKAVEVKPDFLSGLSAVVSLLIQQNKLEDAAKHLVAMTKIAPRHPQTLYLKAQLAYRQQNLVAAREAIQQQLRAAPDNLPGLLLAGAIESELKSYAQAEAHLSKVLQRVPGQTSARRILAKSYLRRGEPGKAFDVLKPVLQNIADNPNMLALAGEVYMMNGEPKQAADYFAKAAARNPGNSAMRTSLALSRMAQGKTDTAFHELEETAASDSGIRADLALIAGHMQRREYDKALVAIARLENKQPGSALPHNLRGGVLLEKGDVAGARRSFERALEKDPTYFLAAANLAKLDVAEKKPEAARQRFEAVLAKNPKQLQALLALAELKARTGGTSVEVVALISKAISAHPTEPAPRLALMGYYVGQKEAKKAVAAAQEALAALPNRPEILDAAGRAHQAAGETSQALSIYNKLASLQPRSPLPHLRMAEVQAAAKNRDGALESLRKALSIKPDLIDAQRGIIALELDAGRLQEAIAVAREVQKQRPKQSVGYIFEGDIYAARKKWTEAATAYRAGLGQVSSTNLAVKLHAALAASSGADSERFAANWLKEHPKDDAFRLHLAQSAFARKDYPTAAIHYRKLHESEPDNPLVLNNLASVEAQLKDPKALEYAERANKLAPDQPAFMDTLGMLLMEKGETARALQLLQKASALAPHAANIRLNLAKALIKVGQKEAAGKELDELAKLGDKFSGQAEVAQLKQRL